MTQRSTPEHEDPRDCVRQFPTCSPESVELVAFDWQGIVRFKAEIPRIADVASYHVQLLRDTRSLYPRGPVLTR